MLIMSGPYLSASDMLLTTAQSLPLTPLHCEFGGTFYCLVASRSLTRTGEKASTKRLARFAKSRSFGFLFVAASRLKIRSKFIGMTPLLVTPALCAAAMSGLARFAAPKSCVVERIKYAHYLMPSMLPAGAR